jgi:hypothetical protein
VSAERISNLKSVNLLGMDNVESRRRHGCVCVVSVVCCQGEVYATD